MKKLTVIFAAIVICFAISNNALAQKTTAINVITTVYDFDSTGTQFLLMRSDNYNGAGFATYTTFSGKGANSASVTSQITNDGQWYLAMNDKSARYIWVTPNQAIDGSQPEAPQAGYYAIQKAYSNCRDQSGNIIPYSNLVNGSSNCSMAINFFYGGVLYKLLMRPDALDNTLCPSGGCPATGLAKVTCNAVSAGKCVKWTIVPNDGAPLVGVANLYSYTGPSGSPWVYIGQYNNTFRVNAAKQ